MLRADALGIALWIPVTFLLSALFGYYGYGGLMFATAGQARLRQIPALVGVLCLSYAASFFGVFFIGGALDTPQYLVSQALASLGSVLGCLAGWLFGGYKYVDPRAPVEKALPPVATDMVIPPPPEPAPKTEPPSVWGQLKKD
jgi:hypothetical protein